MRPLDLQPALPDICNPGASSGMSPAPSLGACSPMPYQDTGGPLGWSHQTVMLGKLFFVIPKHLLEQSKVSYTEKM
jgi:hypothetical protein